MAREIIFKLRELSRQMKEQNISAHAGSSAFFIFVSLLPMLIMICTIIPFTPLTEANLERAITEMTPEMIDPLAVRLVREVYEKSAGILSVAAITTLWSAGKGVLAIMRGLNDINDAGEKRNYFLVRIVASCYTLLLLFMVIIGLLLMVFGNEVMNVLLIRNPRLEGITSFLHHFRFVAVWAFLTMFFSLIYTYVPNVKMKFKEQLTGAMFAAILWSVFSWGFSIYVDRGVSGSMYGNLSLVIIVMLWLYFGMYIVFVGAYLNRCWGQREDLRQ